MTGYDSRGQDIRFPTTQLSVAHRSKNAMRDKSADRVSGICGFPAVVLLDSSEINTAFHLTRKIPMNSLFLACLTLFFAQGLMGRDNFSARMFAALIVATLVAVLIDSIGRW